METNVIFGKIYNYGNKTGFKNEGTDDHHHECPDGWRNFWAPFIYVREELELTVCVGGCLTNIINILIFTRKSMRNPTSTIFTALALADFLFLFQQIIASSLHLYRKYNGDSRSLPNMMIEQTVLQYSFEIFHGWSIYLTLLVAIWRYLGTCYPLRSRRWCTAGSAKWAILSLVLMTTVTIFLICLAIQIEDLHNDTVKDKVRVSHRHEFLLIYVLVVKFIPCTLLFIFFIGLIWSLVKARRLRRQLYGSGCGSRNFRAQIVQQSVTTSMSPLRCTRLSKISEILARKDQVEFDRTTKTLVLVLLFLATEFPFGILELLMEQNYGMDPVKSPTFYMECYFPILSFFVFDELISSAASFFVYLSMSNRFRSTFVTHSVTSFKIFKGFFQKYFPRR